MILAESLTKENCIDPSLRLPASAGQVCSLLWWKDPFLLYQGTLPSPHTRALTFAFINRPGQCSAKEESKRLYCPPLQYTRSCSAFTLHFITALSPWGWKGSREAQAHFLPQFPKF